jgi:uncharacterized oxidoreductase
MKMSGNTILITGGGSGIGRGLAEAFHRRGNQVIVTGRRKDRLQDVIEANPGMVAAELDVTDPSSIAAVTARLLAEHPALNVLINNAGVMLIDDAAGTVDEDLLETTVKTNFGGPVRMTSALVEHLKRQPDAVIVHVTSILAFVPIAQTAIYSALKAALHSYTLSQRYLLRGAGVKVIEIAPPWVRTDLLNSTKEERAMPLGEFITGAMEQLATDADEILVGPAPQMRANPGPNEHVWVTEFNDMIASGPALG